MATVKLCDRCRKESPLEVAETKWVTVSLREPGITNPMIRDLCPDCTKEYRKFISPLPQAG